MADRDEPSLELPSFSLRRKKRDAVDAESEPPAQEPQPDRPGTPLFVDEQQARQRPARAFRRTTVPGQVAVSLTGALVGLLAVGLTWLLLRFCDAVSGTSSCGGGPGLLLMLLAIAVLTVAGTGSLRAFGVQHAGSTSVLAVGLLAVLALLFLVDVLFAWWMVLVIPAVAVLAFALAYAVTTAATED